MRDLGESHETKRRGGTKEMVYRELLLLVVLPEGASLDVPHVALTVGDAPHRFSRILIGLL